MNFKSKPLAGLPILILGLPCAGPAWAQHCYEELPRCVERITVTEKEITLRNGCDFPVAVKIKVNNGLDEGISYLIPHGEPYTLDEGNLLKMTDGPDPTYSTDLRCCLGIPDHECIELSDYPGLF